LPGVSSTYRDLIEQRKPYHGTEDSERLRVLAVLSNTDKHQVIPIVLMAPADIALEFRPVRCRVTEVRLAQRPVLKPRTELVRLYITPDNPNLGHEMHGHADLKPYIALDNRVDAVIQLRDIADTVEAVIEECAEAFAGVH
jgi:hypothetical protein